MVRRVVWTKEAQKDRKEIFSYWNRRNQSKFYSKKLNQFFQNSIQLIVKFPNIGLPTEIENVQIVIIKNYYLIYELLENNIIILSIWDCRQNPLKLKYKPL